MTRSTTLIKTQLNLSYTPLHMFDCGQELLRHKSCSLRFPCLANGVITLTKRNSPSFESNTERKPLFLQLMLSDQCSNMLHITCTANQNWTPNYSAQRELTPPKLVRNYRFTDAPLPSMSIGWFAHTVYHGFQTSLHAYGSAIYIVSIFTLGFNTSVSPRRSCALDFFFFYDARFYNAMRQSSSHYHDNRYLARRPYH